MLVIGVTVTATVCTSGIFILVYILISFFIGRSHHQSLISNAKLLTQRSNPELAKIIQRGERRLKPGPIQVYVVPSMQVNAYTFGISSPKVVVLYSALFKLMDKDEILFILGHEFGHVALGHTWLNSLVGGIAGIPSSWSVGALLTMVFLWWNRTCELSADRAGLLACGNLDKAISALIKIGAGTNVKTTNAMEMAYQRIDAEDDTVWGNVKETLATHPMLIRRIQELRKFAVSDRYRRMQVRVNQNL